MHSDWYQHRNKAGKLLIQQLQEKRVKQKIPHLFHPTTGIKITNTQEIVDALSVYYGSLYNLQQYSSIS